MPFSAARHLLDRFGQGDSSGARGANIVSRLLLRAAILDPSLFTMSVMGGIENEKAFFRSRIPCALMASASKLHVMQYDVTAN